MGIDLIGHKTPWYIKLIHAKWFQLLVILLVVSLAVFLINENFASRVNIRGLMRGAIVPGILIVAVGPLLAGGGIDLATSTQATFAAIVFVKFTREVDMPWGFGVAAALLVGVIFGLINVLLIVRFNFLAFIATIGMSTIYIGLSRMWTEMLEVMHTNHDIIALGNLSILNNWVPVLFIFMTVLVAAYVYMMANTRFGRSIYMAGGNEAAARLAGLNPKKIRAILFINSGVIAALAGVVWSALNRMAHPSSLNESMPHFMTLTAVIIGGVSFRGGSGNLAAGFIGLLLVRVFDNGLTILGSRSYVNMAAQGLILIVALIADHINAVRQRRALEAAAIAAVDEQVIKA